MKLTDIIALATKGYKPNDIRDLIALANESEKLEAAAAEEDNVPVEEQKEPEEAPEPEHDYAAELAALRSETEKLRADLKAAQDANRSARIPEVTRKSRSEELADIARAMMR